MSTEMLEVPLDTLQLGNISKPAFSGRRNTEKLHEKSFLDPNSLVVRDLQHRRHTIDPGVKKSELFEKETKLIVLEFLQKNTPRNEALTYRLREKSSLNLVCDKQKEETTVPPEVAIVPIEFKKQDISNEQSKRDTEKCHPINNNDSEAETLCKKRAKKRLRKIGSVKSKTVTIGDNDHKQMVEEIRKTHQSDQHRKPKYNYKRSTSDLTSEQYETMKKKIKEMQLPIIQWLSSHVKPEDSLPPPIMEEEIIKPEHEFLLCSSNFDDGDHDDKSCERKTVPEEEQKPNLTLKIPRRSIYELFDEDGITPETYAVNQLEKISNEIMNDYGVLLADPVETLIDSVRTTDFLSYDTFAGIARQVYNMATSGGVLSRTALLLNTVRETMLEGNLDETQMELLVDHSTKFMTENVPHEMIEKGNWESLTEPDFGNALKDEKDREEVERVDNERPADWTPFGMAALTTVGLGLAYSVMK